MTEAYTRAIQYLYSLERRGIELKLDRVRKALSLLGNPERSLRFVHVAGTNGKGSVCAMLERTLRAAGYRTGLFTSPHLHHFVERIRVGGRPVARSIFTEEMSKIRDRLQADEALELSFFETAFVLALLIFERAKCDVVALEVGLGGRLDATNVVHPLVTVITQVGFDHEHILGKTLTKIAAEKAGILKPRVPLVCGVTEHVPAKVIRQVASDRRAPVMWFGQDYHLERGSRSGRINVRVGRRVLRDLRVSLPGAHQERNAAIAVATVFSLRKKGLPVSDDAIAQGLGTVKWPGRLERVRGQPDYLLDAGHNLAGSQALVSYLHQLPQERRVLLFGAMADKDGRGMLRALAPQFSRLIFVAPPMAKATSPQKFAAWHRGRVARSVASAMSMASRSAGPDGLVVVAGSIFLVADVRAKILGIKPEPLVRM